MLIASTSVLACVTQQHLVEFTAQVQMHAPTHLPHSPHHATHSHTQAHTHRQRKQLRQETHPSPPPTRTANRKQTNYRKAHLKNKHSGNQFLTALLPSARMPEEHTAAFARRLPQQVDEQLGQHAHVAIETLLPPSGFPDCVHGRRALASASNCQLRRTNMPICKRAWFLSDCTTQVPC